MIDGELRRLLNQIWPQGIPIKHYPLVEYVVKSIYRDGQWHYADGTPDERVFNNLAAMIESQQAPSIQASLNFAEQRRLSQAAGVPITSYREADQAGLALDSYQFQAPPPPPKKVEATSFVEARERAEGGTVPPNFRERLANGERFETKIGPDGKIHVTEMPKTNPDLVGNGLPPGDLGGNDVLDEGPITDAPQAVTQEMLGANALKRLAAKNPRAKEVLSKHVN